MPLDIVGVETTREADGLALSSRNVYLSAEERKNAPALNRVLRDVAVKSHDAVRGLGEARKGKAPRPAPLVRDPTLPPQTHQLPELDVICAAAAAELQVAGFTKVDYVAVRHANTLKVVTETGAGPLRVLGAAWLGSTRLIDNVGA
jgi:pantoate--beta-alanine ligase